MKKNTLLFLILALSFFWNSQAQLTEGFEGGVPPTGWTSFRGTNNQGITRDWTTSNITNSGSSAAFVRWEDSGAINEDWLVTGLVDLSASTYAQLRFFARQDFAANFGSTYSIRVSTVNQTTHANFTTIKSWSEVELNTVNDVYEEKVVDLSAYDGASVYVAFVLTNDDGDSWWIDDITIADAPPCESPSSINVDGITDTSANLSWGSIVTASLGYNWVIMTSGDDPDVDTPIDSDSTANGVTTDATTGLTTSTSYDFYVRADCDTNGISNWSAVQQFSTLAAPPSNDDMCNAIVLAFDSPTSGGTYTNTGATLETSEVGGSCWFSSDPPSHSVWFSFTAPPSGDVRITTVFTDGSLADTQMTLYTASNCGDLSTLTQIACDDDDDGNIDPSSVNQALIQTTGLATDGTVYYVQIDGYLTAEGSFDIALYDLSTLSHTSVDNPKLFSYFPNPVKDELQIRAQNIIQNISIYNMLGQEVIIKAPHDISSKINMSYLSIGTYFAKVTINNVTETFRIIKK